MSHVRTCENCGKPLGRRYPNRQIRCHLCQRKICYECKRVLIYTDGLMRTTCAQCDEQDLLDFVARHQRVSPNQIGIPFQGHKIYGIPYYSGM